MHSLLKTVAALAAGLAATAAGAVEFDAGGANVAINSKLSVGAAMRVQDRNPDLIGLANGGNAYSTNGDDGNLAFGPGQLFAGGTKLTSDVGITFGEFGLFVRGSGLYSPVLDKKGTYFDPTDYQPYAQREQPRSEFDYKTETVQHATGLTARLLDAYAYGHVALGSRTLTMKVGRQVLNWGESSFVQNGLNALVAADVNKLRVPGFEVEEVQTPVGMALLSFDLLERVSVEGFYQFEWQPSVIDASGTMLSTNDFAGIAGTQANIGFGRVAENADDTSTCVPIPPPPGNAFCVPFGSTVPRGPDREPRNGGQFGGKLSFYIPALNDMDLSLYAAKYHSRLPLVSGTSRTTITSATDTSNYFIEYPEDIKMYGASFNTTVPRVDVAVQGEVSYKVDQPLQLDDVELLLNGLGAPNQINAIPGAALGNQYMRGWRRHDVTLADLGFTKIIGPRFLVDQYSLFLEVGYVHANLPPPETLAYDAPYTYTLNQGTAALNPSVAAGLPITPYSNYATRDSYGYKAAAKLTFNNVFDVLTVEPTVLFQHDLKGITPTPLLNFIENRKQVNAILSFAYLQSYSFDVGYTRFFGGGVQNLLSDRDYVEASLKYSF